VYHRIYVRAVVAILVGTCALGCGGGTDESSIVVELSSKYDPLDSATDSVFGERGAIVTDRRLTDAGTLELPRRVRIEGGDREGPIRILVWGERDGTRVAFGAATAQLAIGVEDDVDLELAAPPGDCDADGVPDTLDGCAAIADPSQDDDDGDGTTNACTPGAGCAANRVTNPGFESTTTGWRASTANPATLAVVAGGRDSVSAGRVCKIANGGTAEYSIDDNPATIGTPSEGARFRVDAWVRADAPAAQRIDLRVGEMSIPGENPIDATVASVTATTDWQLITTLYAIGSAPGTSTLDVRFRVLGAVDGSCFQVDDVCVQELAPACP
jgi:hypothetical protein